MHISILADIMLALHSAEMLKHPGSANHVPRRRRHNHSNNLGTGNGHGQSCSCLAGGRHVGTPRSRRQRNASFVISASSSKVDFLHIDDFSRDDIESMLSRAAEVKERLKTGDRTFLPFNGMTMSMIFAKNSSYWSRMQDAWKLW